MDENGPVAFPEDLTVLTPEELTALEARALAEFDSLADDENVDAAGIERMTALADGIEALRAAHASRVAATVQMAGKRDKLRERMSKIKTLQPAEGTAGEGDGDAAGEDGAAAAAEIVVAAEVESTAASVETPRERVRPSLAAAQARAPEVPDRASSRLAIVAAAPSSGVQIGHRFADIDQLTAAVQGNARSLTITHGQPAFLTVASIENQFDHVIDGERTSTREFEELRRALVTPDQMESIVAGGGWCAPSEIRYDFFNIACQDGMVDLPTFGVRRGGVQVPRSPSLADVFTGAFTNATNPWLWTEADDILTVTGTPNKPCVRVPCAAHDNYRLECYGICLTAGNLTDNAWPEATRNFLSLLMSAHFHAANQRYITQMVALSTAATVIPTGVGGSGEAISSDLPDQVAVAANDYRERYGMCEDDVLEVILPRWARDAIKSDLLRRTGVDFTSVSDADVNALFTTRNVRIQWVGDWQVRATGQPGGSVILSAWPDTVTFMIYAAGTFMLGNGMTLDLGVVRDSVLNNENDHTAAWMEECHLVARFGHESRLYTIPVCVAGRTGSANIVNCHVV